MNSSLHSWRDSLAFFNSDLFRHVQMAELFPDSKTFADAIVKTDLTTVLQQYEQELQIASEEGGEVDLHNFVDAHFTLPDSDNATSTLPCDDITTYIANMWNVLTRTPDTQHKDSLIALARPYIVPGGRFREIYYWDSYFTAQGLVHAGRSDMAINMLENFVDILNEVGCIPNGNRAYYHSRSQPPILALFYNLLENQLSEKQRAYIIDGLKKEYAFWMQGANKALSDGDKALSDGDKAFSEDKALSDRNKASSETSRDHVKTRAELRTVTMPCGAVLNRYFDPEPTPRPESYREDIETANNINADKGGFYQHIRAACESGWDFSSRWLENPQQLESIRTTELLPIDLNALLASLEQTLSRVTEGKERAIYQDALTSRKQAINTYLYSAKKGGYFDCHFPSMTQTSVVSAAMTVPLFVNIASDTQAATVQHTLMNDLLKKGGVVTTTNTTSQQWDAPNGWAPLQFFAAIGMANYGFNDDATEIMQRFCTTVEDSFANTGALLEKYNVCVPTETAGGGEYDVQLGFGWTNGVYSYFKNALKG